MSNEIVTTHLPNLVSGSFDKFIRHYFRLRPIGLALRDFRLRPIGLALRDFRLRPIGLALRATLDT
jgi:hypothetical protein